MNWPVAKWCIRNVMLMAIQSVDPNQNLIQDSCLYEVEFPRCEQLTANIIAELMYALCDVNRNEYLLLE